MKCPHCGTDKYQRLDGHTQRPVVHDGVIFRQHKCLSLICGRVFLSAQLVIVNEQEPVQRLDSVLKELLDVADAEIEPDVPVVPSPEGHTNGAESFRRNEAAYEGINDEE